MRPYTRFLLTIALLLLPGLAFAARDHARVAYPQTGSGSSVKQELLDDVALNAAAATRTITVYTEGYAGLKVFVFFTYTAATTVTAQFSCSVDGTNFARETSRSTAAGASTVSLQSDTYTTGAASADFSLYYDVLGCKAVQVLFGGASAGASDLVDVQAVLYVGE